MQTPQGTVDVGRSLHEHRPKDKAGSSLNKSEKKMDQDPAVQAAVDSLPQGLKLIFNSPADKSGLTVHTMPSGKKRKKHKMATHKRKKRLRKNRHKKK